ncbi:hypothetical protein DFH09DRAFT_1283098 [Mycena vulgaris]|nr:hypothetical protein DFH09DRAFT_1283098 [Mycena vulgaris]
MQLFTHVTGTSGINSECRPVDSAAKSATIVIRSPSGILVTPRSLVVRAWLPVTPLALASPNLEKSCERIQAVASLAIVVDDITRVGNRTSAGVSIVELAIIVKIAEGHNIHKPISALVIARSLTTLYEPKDLCAGNRARWELYVIEGAVIVGPLVSVRQGQVILDFGISWCTGLNKIGLLPEQPMAAFKPMMAVTPQVLSERSEGYRRDARLATSGLQQSSSMPVRASTVAGTKKVLRSTIPQSTGSRVQYSGLEELTGLGFRDTKGVNRVKLRAKRDAEDDLCFAGLAWPGSHGFGLALSGSGSAFSKLGPKPAASQARPEPVA